MVVDCSVRSRIGSDTSFTNTDPETEAATADNDNHEAGDTIVVPDPEQTGEVVAKAKAKVEMYLHYSNIFISLYCSGCSQCSQNTDGQFSVFRRISTPSYY